MYSFIPLFLLNPPARLKVLGQALAHFSLILLVLGLYLRIGAVAISALPVMKGVNRAPATLATMYPSVPTWFVPESTVVFAILFVTLALGIYLSFLAKKMERMFIR
jgi:hypothetical protein